MPIRAANTELPEEGPCAPTGKIDKLWHKLHKDWDDYLCPSENGEALKIVCIQELLV